MVQRLLSLLVLASILSAQQTVGYTHTSFDPGVGYTSIRKDPIAGGVLMPSKNGGIGIFVTDYFEYVISTGLGTHIGGTGSLVDTAPADLPLSYGGANPGGLPNRPGDRHAVSQMAVDPTNGLFFIGGGISRNSSYSSAAGMAISGNNVTCGGSCNFPIDGSWTGLRVFVSGSGNCPNAGSYCTISTVADDTHMSFTAPGPGTLPGSYSLNFVDQAMGANSGYWTDMYCLQLNSDPTMDLWSRWQPTHYPITISGASYYYQGAWVYDKDDGLLFHLEGNHLFSYASTRTSCAGSPSGTLSAAQTAAGASTADDWALLTSSLPFNAVYLGAAYDSHLQLVWIYGGVNGAGTTSYNALYAYNPGGSTRFGITSHSVLQVCSGACSPPPTEATNPPAGFITTVHSGIDFNPNRNTLLYYHTRDNDGTSDPGTWEYDPTTDLWTLLTSTATGSTDTNGIQLAFDPATNIIVTAGVVNGTYKGQLSSVVVEGSATFGGKLSQGGKHAN